MSSLKTRPTGLEPGNTPATDPADNRLARYVGMVNAATPMLQGGRMPRELDAWWMARVDDAAIATEIEEFLQGLQGLARSAGEQALVQFMLGCLRTQEQARVALLAGLMDSMGTKPAMERLIQQLWSRNASSLDRAMGSDLEMTAVASLAAEGDSPDEVARQSVRQLREMLLLPERHPRSFQALVYVGVLRASVDRMLVPAWNAVRRMTPDQASRLLRCRQQSVNALLAGASKAQLSAAVQWTMGLEGAMACKAWPVLREIPAFLAYLVDQGAGISRCLKAGQARAGSVSNQALAWSGWAQLCTLVMFNESMNVGCEPGARPGEQTWHSLTPHQAACIAGYAVAAWQEPGSSTGLACGEPGPVPVTLPGMLIGQWCVHWESLLTQSALNLIAAQAAAPAQ